MMNLAVGLAESFADAVPVLAIVGQPPAACEGRGAFQDSSGIGDTLDAVGMFQSICKHVERVDDPTRFWGQLQAAARATLTGRPGPSVLLVPRDAYESAVPPAPRGFPTTIDDARPPRRIDGDGVSSLFDALARAERPVIIAGPGSSRSRSAAALIRFARAARIPVATTMGDPAAFPSDDALWLGVVGAAGHPSAHAYLRERADRVVAAGVALNAIAWQPPGPFEGGAAGRRRYAVVHQDGGALARVLDADIVVEGDPGEVFQELIVRHRSRPFIHEPVRDYALTRYRPALEQAQVRPGLRQSEALEVIDAHLPRVGHVLFDAGNCGAAALHCLSIPSGTSSTIALGMGGMGYAIAGAVGAQLGSAKPRCVVLCGDGSFLMHGLEVHTAVDLRLPILFVVFNNQRHGMCVTRQRRFFDGRIECAEYGAVDVAAIARGLGPPAALWVGSASSRESLERRLQEYDDSLEPRTGVLELRLVVEEIPPFQTLMGPARQETGVVDDASPAPSRPVTVF